MKGLSTLYNKLTGKSAPAGQEEGVSTPEHTNYWESYKHMIMPAITVGAAMTTAAMYYFNRQQDGGNEQEVLVPGLVPTGNYTSYGSDAVAATLPVQELLSSLTYAAGALFSSLASVQFGPIGADAAMISTQRYFSGKELSTIPVGNCTFYAQYLKANPEVADWLNGIICGVSTQLFLNYTNLGPAGASALAPALQQLTALTNLDLTGNNLGPAGASALAPALQQLIGMSQLYLNNNTIGPAGASALAPALQQLIGMSQLYFGDNNISDAGASALAPALQQLTALVDLSLAGNNIGDAGASALAPALQQLTALAYLFLNKNNIGPTGAAALGSALESLHSLSVVDLSDNDVGLVGCTNFTSEIQINNPDAIVECN